MVKSEKSAIEYQAIHVLKQLRKNITINMDDLDGIAETMWKLTEKVVSLRYSRDLWYNKCKKLSKELKELKKGR